MEEHGIDFRRELELFEAFRRWLNDGVRSLPEPLRKQAVLLMVATTAAAEHFTASLAGYVLSDNTWGETDVDPEMAHLFLWHAAEEVAHRHVAYDVSHHISGGYLHRAAALVPLAGLALCGWPLLNLAAMRGGTAEGGRSGE